MEDYFKVKESMIIGWQHTNWKRIYLANPEQEVAILGVQDQFVSLLEEGLSVSVRPFGNSIKVSGEPFQVQKAMAILKKTWINLSKKGFNWTVRTW